MTPDQYCEDRLDSGSSAYYSLRFVAPGKRRAIVPLLALCRELAEIADSHGEVVIAQRKLDWWRDEIDACFAGRPSHPVTRALQPALQHYNLPAEYFHEIVDGVSMDLHRQRYANFSELALYCQRVAGVVHLMLAEIFGYRRRQTLKYAETLGTALRLTRMIRDLRRDLDHDRLYLPLDELRAHAIHPDAVSADAEKLRALLTVQAARAREYFERAFACLPEEDRYAQRGGLILAAIHQALLTEIEAEGYPVMRQRLQLTPLRKLWIAWNTNRRERKHQRRIGK